MYKLTTLLIKRANEKQMQIKIPNELTASLNNIWKNNICELQPCNLDEIIKEIHWRNQGSWLNEDTEAIIDLVESIARKIKKSKKIQNTYLVQIEFDDTTQKAKLCNGNEIIKLCTEMDFNNIHDIVVFDATEYGNIKKLQLKCDIKHPNHVIFTDEFDNIVIDGYGEEH